MHYLGTSKPTFWHDQHVTRQQFQVLLHLAAVDESIQFDLDVLFLAVDDAGDMRAISSRKLAHSADGKQGVQNGHTVPVWHGLRLHYLANHFDLAEHADR